MNIVCFVILRASQVIMRKARRKRLSPLSQERHKAGPLSTKCWARYIQMLKMYCMSLEMVVVSSVSRPEHHLCFDRRFGTKGSIINTDVRCDNAGGLPTTSIITSGSSLRILSRHPFISRVRSRDLHILTPGTVGVTEACHVMRESEAQEMLLSYTLVPKDQHVFANGACISNDTVNPDMSGLHSIL